MDFVEHGLWVVMNGGKQEELYYIMFFGALLSSSVMPPAVQAAIPLAVALSLPGSKTVSG
jgi:hypothetical protein